MAHLKENGNKNVCFQITFIFIVFYSQLDSIHTFDLNSAILQLSNLQGKFPISLAELKQLATTGVLQKLIQGKGIIPTFPSLASLSQGNPTQLANILSKLKPSQGRFEPQLEELLSNAFQTRLHTSSSSSSSSPQFTVEEDEDGESTEYDNSHGTYHTSTKYPQPPIITRHGLQKFSSKFRNRNRQKYKPSNYKPTTSMIRTHEYEIEHTEAPPPYQHITDPNIRNHRLYSNLDEQILKNSQINNNNYENFTIIDQAEDLMMDESSILIPLSSTSSESPTTSTSGWIGVSPERPPPSIPEILSKPSDDEMVYLREPLKKIFSEQYIHSEEENHSMNTENYFRPSPPDTNGPKFIEPDQDFFTSTIRQTNIDKSERKPYTMPEFPTKFKKKLDSNKQDRILNQKQNYDEEFLSNYARPHKFYNQNPLRILPIPPQRSSKIPIPPPPHYGHNNHPFAHYSFRDQYMSPAYTHNKYSYLQGNENGDGQTEASDKIDSSWTSTFFLLGGLVAASAVVAFILPGILSTVTSVGKDNDFDDISSGNSNTNKDFWNEVKGLYNDLTHIARGDFNHFKDYENNLKFEKPFKKNEGMVDNEESSERNFNKNKYNLNNVNVNLNDDNETTLAFPVNSGYSLFSNTTRNSLINSNNTFLREWARVQLHLIDS